MPAFTPNRGYPYSVPTDLTDIPGDIQALAEAVDTDVQALQALVGPRPMARVRGVTPVTLSGSGGPGDFGTLPMELIDFNVGGAIAPITDGTARILLPGMWLVLATYTYAIPGGPNIAVVGVEIVDESNSTVGNAGTHVLPAVPEQQRAMDVSGMKIATPTSYLFLRAEVRRFSGGSPQTFRERSITLLRMTQS